MTTSKHVYPVPLPSFFLLVWICLGIAPKAIADPPEFVHVFEEGLFGKTSFTDSLYVFVDQEKKYDIYKIIASRDLPFIRLLPSFSVDPPFEAWSTLVLRNESTQIRNEYFSLCLDADSSWVYVVEDNRVIGEYVSGQNFHPSNKPIPSKYNYIPISIEAGKEKTVYFRLLFTKPIGAIHLSHVFIQPGEPLIHRVIGQYVWHSFYAGMMLLFTLLGLFMFRLFRERMFLHLALFILFLALYFIHIKGMTDALITNWFSIHDVSLGQLIISGLIFTGFMYFTGYTHLRDRLPRLYRILQIYTLFVVIYGHLAPLVWGISNNWILSQNIILAIWVFFIMSLIAFLAIKRNADAQVLLIATGVMAIGSLINLISLQNISPTGGWMEHGFQIGSIVFAGILLYNLFENVAQIRNEKQRIEELDRLKSTFFTNISHEFRTPLTLMMGPLQQLLEETEDPHRRKLLEMASQNATQQLKLINQILDLSKLEAGKMELIVQEDNFTPYLKGVVQSYASLATLCEIRLEASISDKPRPLFFNRTSMDTILYNLLSNAFKFTETGGSIVVALRTHKHNIEVHISDTGQGISSEKLPYIFDRFFQAEATHIDAREGSGIGLALVRELVHQQGGRIEVQSREGQGTEFVLLFPLGKDHFPPETIFVFEEPPIGSTPRQVNNILIDEKESFPNQAYDEHEDSQAQTPLILIIEDNADVRYFIRLQLENNYRIIEAVDGMDGVEKAIAFMPDLIISDVMMPGANGYEVCNTLKTDLRTCHIPIILLTAKADIEEKIEGLQTGADDYLTKPFDPRELTVRVQNLIRQRQQLRERFAASIFLKPSEVVTNSLDKEFLEQALAIVETNMGDEHFNIDILAREMGMSRANLNRKLRALVNQSSNQFIQITRLQRAAELLRQQAGTVSEIAFLTGFSSVAYFVKCFKDQFGETPGSFRS